MKNDDSVKILDFIGKAKEALDKFLRQVPRLKVTSNLALKLISTIDYIDYGFDFSFEVTDKTTLWTILGFAKNTSHPSRLINALLKFANLSKLGKVYVVLVVPWMSEKLESQCLALGLGCVDLEGNGVLRFGNMFARSTGKPPPKQEIQSLKSLFSSKATRVLRILLRDPKHFWRTQPLADAAEISLGYVHKISIALEERGWLEKTRQGIRLSHPKDLLETWQNSYTPLPRAMFYTLKHGKNLQESLLGNDGQHWIYAGLSASDWLAPLVRQPNLQILADEIGIAQLETRLELKPVSSGFNVVIFLDQESNILRDRFEVASGIWTSSPVQTYLELANGNDRAQEAAQHLFKERIAPAWETI
ncbi:MAG: hypothetical protein RLZZ156_2702 [Deinococcota bacterium]